MAVLVPVSNNTKDITSGAGIGSPPGAPEFTSSFSVVCVAQSVDLCIVFFVDHCFLGHSMFCPSSIYGF